MIVTLSSALACQTMRDRTHSCDQPTTIALLRTIETFDSSNYTLQPLCPRCIAQLAAAAGQATPAPTEAIEAETIKRVLSAHLGLEGADQVLSEMRAAGVDEEDSYHADT